MTAPARDWDTLFRLHLNMTRSKLDLLDFYFGLPIGARPAFEPKIAELIAEWRSTVDEATCHLINGTPSSEGDSRG